MYGMDVFMLKKLHYLRSQYQKATVSVRVKSTITTSFTSR